ncbi:MAG: tRNA-binding protein [Bacteroidota bacterium]
MSATITWNEFENIDLRVGTVLEAHAFPKARKPAYQLTIDFGELGVRRSSAQITKHYRLEDLQGRQVIAVVNFPPKQIANFWSECLVLGVVGEAGSVVLLQPERPVANGAKIG